MHSRPSLIFKSIIIEQVTSNESGILLMIQTLNTEALQLFTMKIGEVVVRRRTFCRLSLRSHAIKQCLRRIVINVDTYVDRH
jgi:hypothetical protein